MAYADAPSYSLKPADRKRSRQRQQYGARHRGTRRRWASAVAAGAVRCARCLELIEPGSAWDLGHDDRRPWLHTGPEHASCNRGAPHRNQTSRAW